MAVTLTKPVEEIFPQPAQAVKQKAQSLVIEVERPPQNPPAVAQSAVVYKEATVTTADKKGRLHHEVKNIPLNDLTALNKNELRALTNQSVKEIEEAFALIQRVATEGERRAELDPFWGDDFYSDVCEFHTGVFPKMAAYNKRHRKTHPGIYKDEFGWEFWAILGIVLAEVVAGVVLGVMQLLGLF